MLQGLDQQLHPQPLELRFLEQYPALAYDTLKEFL